MNITKLNYYATLLYLLLAPNLWIACGQQKHAEDRKQLIDKQSSLMKNGASPITLSTDSLSNAVFGIRSNQAIAKGMFAQLKDDTVLQYGHCWSTSAHPTIADERRQSGVMSNRQTFSSRMLELEANTQYYVRSYAISLTDTIYGLELNFFTTPAQNNIYFPDLNFKKALLNKHQIDNNADGEISFEEAKAYNKGIYVQSCKIKDLSGIEAFININELDCFDNNLVRLNVSKCHELKRLSFGRNNELKELDASGCKNLLNLECSASNLAHIDASGCSSLTYLYCSNNNLTSLNVSNCPALARLDCHRNNLQTLDVSGCKSLQYLDCHDNNLSCLDVNKRFKLTYIDCSENLINSLMLENCKSLTYLECSNNQLTTLDVTTCIALDRLHCHRNKLTELDISQNPALYWLVCYRNTNMKNVTVASEKQWNAITYKETRGIDYVLKEDTNN